MPDARLSVEVGAKIDELQTKMAAAKASVKSFTGYTDAELLKTSQHFQKGGDKAGYYSNALGENAIAAQRAAAAQKVLNAEVATGSSALASVGVGATKALSALRTMAYILPGIGIAGIFNLAYGAIGPLIGKLFEGNKALEKLRDTTITLIQVQQKGQENAQKELATADTLYRATQNLNLSLSERTKAVNILQEKYPSYLKNISDEDILAGKAADAYIRLKDAIIAKAVAQAKEEEIAKLAIENEKLKFRNQVIDQAKLRLNKTDVDRRSNVSGEGVVESNEEVSNRLKIDVLEKESIANHNVMVRNNETQLFLSKQIDASIEKAGVDMLTLGTNAKKASDDIKAVRDVLPLEDAQFTGKNKANIYGQKTVDIVRADDLKLSVMEFMQYYGTISKEVGQKAANNLTEPLFYFSDYLSQKLVPQFESTFNNFFNDILEKGTFSFQALGKAILNTFTSIIASESTQALMGLLNVKNADGSKKSSGLFKGIAGLFGGGATAAAGGGFLATALPIAGIALGALAIGSQLFKKRDRAPDPVYATNGVSTPAMGSHGSSVINVIMTARGRDLVGTLNLEGFYLSRVQNGRG